MFVIGIKTLLTTNTKEKSTITSYFPVYTKGKWGVIDQTGKIIIEPTIEEIITIPNSKKDVFICLSHVNYEDQTYKTKVLNAKNEEILKGYDLVEAVENIDQDQNLWYEEGILKVKKGEFYGLIDFSGKEILAPEYQEVKALEGVKNSVLIKKDDQWGLSDHQGNIIIPTQYREIKGIKENYQNGYIVINQEGKYGMIDFNKAVILEAKYEDIKEIVGNNLYVVKENGNNKVINKQGETVLDNQYGEVQAIYDKNIIVKKNKKYGIINTDKEEKIKPQYEELFYLYNQYYIAKQNGKYGIINEQNETVLPFEYSQIIYHKDVNIIQAEKDGAIKSDIYNTNIEKQLEGIIEEINYNRNYIKVRMEDGYHYYNFKLEEKSSWELLTNRTLFLSKKDGKYGYINQDGNVVVDYIYEEAMEFNEYGFAAVKKDGKWGSINQEGKQEAENQYKLEDNIMIDFIGKWHLGQDLNAYYYTDK